jgi:peptide/nickel transport system ATP-binding protein
VDFDILRGETYGLVGESGCGKSTVAHAVMGYLARGASAEGRVLLGGENLLSLPPARLRRIRGRDLAMVYQDPMSSLNPSLTIFSQINEVLSEKRGLARAEGRRVAESLLESVSIAEPRQVLSRYPHQLSGGMRQRVCVAMALAAEPRLLVMDEPTTALDVTTAAQVLDLLPPLRERYNLSVLYISHDLGVVARVCDRVGVMYAGRLVEEAPVRDLFRGPSHPYTRGLMGCLPKPGLTKGDRALKGLPGKVADLGDVPEPCAFSPRCAHHGTAGCLAELEAMALSAASGETSLRERSPGRRSSCDSSAWEPVAGGPESPLAAPGSAPAGLSERPLLEAEGLKSFYRVSKGLWGGQRVLKAVDGVDFRLRAGETLAIVGESGCGKSSLARAVVGLNLVSDGRLSYEGRPIDRRSRKDAGRLMSMVFQNPDSTLNPKHTIGYSIARPLRLSLGRRGRDLEEATLEYLAMVKLGPEYASRYPRELSGGERQRVAIARALASHPGLVVCDEPTSALDVSVQAAIIGLLLDIQSSMGLSYLFISHDLSVVRYVSDQTAIMYLGRFCERGLSSEIFGSPAHPYTKALWSAIPVADPEAVHRPVRLTGPLPSLASPPAGCGFHTRCPERAGRICETEPPSGVELSPTHTVYCHHYRNDLKSVS